MDDNGCLNKLKDAFGPLYHRSSRILSHCLHHVISMKVITRTGWTRIGKCMYHIWAVIYVLPVCHFRTTGNELESQQQHEKIKITPKQTEEAAVNKNKVKLLEKQKSEIAPSFMLLCFTLKVAYYSFIRVQEVYTINVQI